MRTPALTLLALLAASTAHAEPTVEQKIQLLLSAHHGLPSRAEIERLVPEAKAVLMSLAERRELFGHYRHRALEALAMWPDDDVRALYLRLLTSETETVSTKQHVLLRIPRVFGREAPRILEPYTGADDPRLQRAAEAALRKTPPGS